MPRASTPAPSAAVPESGVSKLAVAQHLRERIVAGEFPPGSRLPTRSTLEAFFGTTKVTVQRAFDDLTEDGFITVVGKRGTFVAQAPPHLNRYGLVLSSVEGDNSGTGISSALWKESQRVAAQSARQFPLFQGFHAAFDPPDLRRLLGEIRCHQLAGVIFGYNPGDCEATQLLASQGVPAVAITHSTEPIPILSVCIDYASFFERALDDLAARGLKRIAVLVPGTLSTYGAQDFGNAARARGLQTEPYWWLPMDLGNPGATQIFTQLLMNPGQLVRPDALIVADDHFLDHAIAGLQDAGVNLAEFPVTAHANFSRVRAVPRPGIRRLGYRVSEALGTCLKLIDQSRGGQSCPAVTKIQAHFEDEELDHD